MIYHFENISLLYRLIASEASALHPHNSTHTNCSYRTYLLTATMSEMEDILLWYF